MSPSERATTPPAGQARSILFGLFADGADERRFRMSDAARLASSAGRTGGTTFSPSGDWYGRWTVQPLHGVLAKPAASAGAICPADIVVLAVERPRRA